MLKSNAQLQRFHMPDEPDSSNPSASFFASGPSNVKLMSLMT
jgi:hypothetical protein